MATEPGDILIDPRHRELLDELARERGTSTAELVREALDAYLPAGPDGDAKASECCTGETLYDRAVRTGFAGAVKGTPADLSTNPKYMEGFGKDGE